MIVSRCTQWQSQCYRAASTTSYYTVALSLLLHTCLPRVHRDSTRSRVDSYHGDNTYTTHLTHAHTASNRETEHGNYAVHRIRVRLLFRWPLHYTRTCSRSDRTVGDKLERVDSTTLPLPDNDTSSHQQPHASTTTTQPQLPPTLYTDDHTLPAQQRHIPLQPTGATARTVVYGVTKRRQRRVQRLAGILSNDTRHCWRRVHHTHTRHSSSRR